MNLGIFILVTANLLFIRVVHGLVSYSFTFKGYGRSPKVKIIDLICFIPLRRLRCYDCAEIPYQSSSKTVHGDIEKSCFSLRDPSCHDIPYGLRCHVDQNRVLKINVTCFQRIFVALGYLAFHAISSNLAV